MKSEIEYEPFLGLICTHDSEWSRQPHEADSGTARPFRRLMEEYSAQAGRYAREIRANYEAYKTANGLTSKKTLSDSYFDPLYYVVLGDSDLLSITLLDDFDPVQYLTGRSITSIKSAILAFSPTLKSLGVPDCGHFWTLSDLRKGTRRLETHTLLPVVSFTRLKMDGMACIGASLHAQLAIWRGVALRIQESLDALCAHAAAENTPGVPKFFGPESISRVKCVLLDLQASEEIGLLILGNHINVACTLIESIRTLTYEDLARSYPALDRYFSFSRVHRKLAEFATEILGSSPTRPHMADNHVFRWSHTRVGISQHESSKENSRVFGNTGSVEGYVAAHSRLRSLPGHTRHAHETLFAEKSEPGQAANCTIQDLGPGFTRFLVGSYDDIAFHSETGMQPLGGPLIRFASVLAYIQVSFERMQARAQQAGEGYRDLCDLETDLLVPIPKLVNAVGKHLIWQDVGKRHSASLAAFLSDLKHAFAPNGCDEPAELGKIRFPPILSINSLRQAQQRLGIPVSLRRVIENLFQDFSIHLSDPFTFDMVLDLYDSFATLHRILTASPGMKGRANATGSRPEGRFLLDEARVKALADFVDGLHNALSHRVAHRYPTGTSRDTALQLRGTLNQMLLAADPPMKCALGVLRRFVLTSDHARDFTSVGCMLRITPLPGARCIKLRLGSEDTARLALFDVDVAHVLHVASYADFLHEGFHLVFTALFDSPEAMTYDFRERFFAAPASVQDRVEEIFAQCLWKLFVFGADTSSYFYHSIATFTRDVSSVGFDDDDTLRRFSELSTRIFLAAYGTADNTGDPRFWKSVPADSPKLSIGKAAEEFAKMLRDAGPFFSEFAHFWDGCNGLDAVQRTATHFERVYAAVVQLLPGVWNMALAVYRKTMNELFPADTADRLHAEQERIDQCITAALREGRPLFWSGYKGRIRGQARTQAVIWNNYIKGGLDPLYFVCRIFYAYISTIKTASGKYVHLLRNESAVLDFAARSNWHDFQIDRGVAALFSPVPEARRLRLRKQIAILKSFWDVGSEIRARRLLHLLEMSSSVRKGKGGGH